jgi:hypothetical protein
MAVPFIMGGQAWLYRLPERRRGYFNKTRKRRIQVNNEINAGQEREKNHEFKDQLDHVLLRVHKINEKIP